jgi:Cu2+-containing amine oxidase
MYDTLVFMNARYSPGIQLTMEDLKVVELVVRKDTKVIEQCMISGIPAEDMHKVYCDRMLRFFWTNTQANKT